MQNERKKNRNVMSSAGSAFRLVLRKSHRARTRRALLSLRQLYVRGFASDIHLWHVVMTSITAHRSTSISNPGLISGQRGCFSNENLGHKREGFPSVKSPFSTGAYRLVILASIEVTIDEMHRNRFELKGMRVLDLTISLNFT